MQNKIGLLLVNLGTPRSTKHKDVAAFLTEFLTDGRVIDIPWLKRQLLVRGLIVPFRHRASAATYRQVWLEAGSPLMVYSQGLVAAMQARLGPTFCVALGMRYQIPSIAQALAQIEEAGVHKLIVLPLFPQYASATSGSVHQKVMSLLQHWQVIPETTFVSSYATHPALIDAFAEIGMRYHPHTFDHILFSFHGLPAKQITKADSQGHCFSSKHCCDQIGLRNHFCYRAQCIATAQAIAQKMQLPKEKYTICFQSRLGKGRWIEPYTSDTAVRLAKEGCKRMLVFSPSFVADCLETLYEIKQELAAEFCAHGGEELVLVEGLNLNTCWLEALQKIVGHYAT